MTDPSFWADRPVLVTGATGILGSWMVRTLVESGAHVVALVLDQDPSSELIRSRTIERVSVVNGQLNDYTTVRRAIGLHEVDTVFHLGAQTQVGVAHRDPLETFESNIRGTYNVLEACRMQADHVRRVVVASSDKAYGTQPDLPYTEDMPLQGQHPYDVSKSCGDLLAQTYSHSYDLPVTIARCGNIYGGGDLNWSRIVPGTIRWLLRGEPPIIRSDGKMVRDYVYVHDVVSAYLLIAEQLEREDVRGEAFNFSTGHPLTVLEVVDAIREVVGRTDIEPRIENTARYEIPAQHLSSEKARQCLGWEPRFDLPVGLAETVAWYRDFLAC